MLGCSINFVRHQHITSSRIVQNGTRLSGFASLRASSPLHNQRSTFAIRRPHSHNVENIFNKQIEKDEKIMNTITTSTPVASQAPKPSVNAFSFFANQEPSPIGLSHEGIFLYPFGRDVFHPSFIPKTEAKTPYTPPAPLHPRPYPLLNPVKCTYPEMWAVYRLTHPYVCAHQSRGDGRHVFYHVLFTKMLPSSLLSSYFPRFYATFVENFKNTTVREHWNHFDNNFYHDLKSPVPSAIRKLTASAASSTKFRHSTHEHDLALQQDILADIPFISSPNVPESALTCDLLPTHNDFIDIPISTNGLDLIRTYLDTVSTAYDFHQEIVQDLDRSSEAYSGKQADAVACVRLYRHQIENVVIRYWLVDFWLRTIITQFLHEQPIVSAFAFSPSQLSECHNLADYLKSFQAGHGDISTNDLNFEIMGPELHPAEPVLDIVFPVEAREQGEVNFSIPIFETNIFTIPDSVISNGEISGVRKIKITSPLATENGIETSLVISVCYAFDPLVIHGMSAPDCSLVNVHTIQNYVTPTLLLAEIQTHDKNEEGADPVVVHRCIINDNREDGTVSAIKNANNSQGINGYFRRKYFSLVQFVLKTNSDTEVQPLEYTKQELQN